MDETKKPEVGQYDYDSSEQFAKGKRDHGVEDVLHFPIEHHGSRIGVYEVQGGGDHEREAF